MNSLEQQLAHFWSHIEAQRDQKLKESGDDLEKEVERELDALLTTLSGSMSEDKLKLDSEIERIMRMTYQFREGVETWHRKAEDGISLIKEKQRSLAVLVQETSARTSARREEMLQLQKHRTDEVRESWQKILANAESSVVE
ncbi:unnamed protein product [Phytomonas sp. Hart1]|nr:unnamed protein product [Phytomonas sp. Hart1]|eukprot:CCW71131.1 unnamed protein product [Phytomonas sp. isolate Hart1]